MPLPKVTFHLENTKTGFDIDPVTSTRLLPEDYLVVAQIFFFELSDAASSKACKSLWTFALRPLGIAVCEPLCKCIEIDLSDCHSWFQRRSRRARS